MRCDECLEGIILRHSPCAYASPLWLCHSIWPIFCWTGKHIILRDKTHEENILSEFTPSCKLPLGNMTMMPILCFLIKHWLIKIWRFGFILDILHFDVSIKRQCGSHVFFICIFFG